LIDYRKFRDWIIKSLNELNKKEKAKQIEKEELIKKLTSKIEKREIANESKD